jgi:hypothetical protein
MHTANSVEPNVEVCGHRWRIRPLSLDEQFEVECILGRIGLGPIGIALSGVVQGFAPTLVELLRENATVKPSMGTPTEDQVAAWREQVGVTAEDVTSEQVRERPDVTFESPLTHEVDARFPASVGAHNLEGRDARVDVRFAEGPSTLSGVVTSVATAPDGSLIARVMVSYDGAAEPERVHVEVQKFTEPREASSGWDLSGLLKIDSSDPRLREPWEKFLRALGDTAGDVVRTLLPDLGERLDHRVLLRLFHLAVVSKAHIQIEGQLHAINMESLGRLLKRPTDKWALLFYALLVTYGEALVDGETGQVDGQ